MSSLTREKVDEICQHIKTNPDAIFGQKYWQCRLACSIQIQQKDRWESRFLAIAKFRVFLLNGKSAANLKVERSFNVLALRNLELLQQEQVLQIGWEDRPGGARQTSTATVVHLFVRMPDGAKTHELALELLATLKHYFPEVQRSLAKMFLALGPPSLLSEFPALPVSTPELPCHNFRRSYVAYCDWMEQPFRDEVIWDIERIYFFHNQKELDLNDFSHLALKDQQALIGSIQFSDFFTGISADGLRLANEHVDALIQLIRRSHSLKSIQLSRCVVPKDFLQLFAAALLLNMNLPLERLRLAGIPLDDRKGLAQLATLLPQLRHLQSLSLPDCGLNEKHALILLHGIHHGIGMAKVGAQAEDGDSTGQQLPRRNHGFQLKALNLSGNPLMNGTELGEQLANLLALNNGAIRLLDLNGTALQLDRLWAALKLGGIGLEILRLGGCHLAPQCKRGNSGKDSAQVARELFANFKALKELNLAGTHLNPDLLQGILSGLAANPNLSKSSVYLCLDNTIVSSSATFVTALEQQLPACPCIRALSLRDNSLEHETFRLLTAIGQMSGIRALDIGGGNFIGLKVNKKHAQMLSGILAELVKLVNENDVDEDDGGELQEGAFIEDLSLSDSRLGSHLGVLLNALGLCRSLKRLDLSNCELGPGGARLLGKSLQLNQSLRHLSLDRNQIGPDGFLELARALRFNFTLLHLQLPTIDLTDAMAAMTRSPIDRSRLQMIMAEIEQSLERNGQLRAADGPTQAQLAMRTVHSLINRCDRYDVNGPEASEVKKIAFHKLGKLVAEMGDEDEMTAAENAEQNGSNNGGGWPVGREPDGSVAGDKRARLVEHLAERIEQMAAESGKNFLRQFVDRLSTQEGVQMAVGMEKEGNGNLANGTLMENGSGNESNAQHGSRLRQELNLLIQKYTSEFAWDQLFAEMDRSLCADENQKRFRILEKAPPKLGSPIRKGILIRNGGGNVQPTAPATALANALLNHHRPVSAMMAPDELHRRSPNGGIVSGVDLMSQSVLGNFASSTTSGAYERENGGGGEFDGNKLVHLAKQRPRPARQNRGKMLATNSAESNAIEEEKAIDGEQELDAKPGPSTAILPPSQQFCAGRPPSQASNLSVSLEQSLEQSPLMQQQRRKHQQLQQQEKDAGEDGEENGGGRANAADEKAASAELLAFGSPPPIPKKGTRESSTPPKLPPKPSPNVEELKKTTTRSGMFSTAMDADD